ncbi:MAG: DUF484 family protein [Rhodospirillaceae bacterium]|nr:DUF484 family protein [Rhodospirillaceae bacterium]
MTGQSDDTAAFSEPDEGVSDSLSEQDVSDFLSGHPDFLVRNPDILKSMEVPSRWTGDGIADMQHFMMEQLRGEIDNLRDCAQDVIETSRSNMSIQTRTHTAVLSLLSAVNFEQLTRAITEDFPLLLDIDIAAVGFEPATAKSQASNVDFIMPGLRRLNVGDVDRFLGRDQDVLLLSETDDDGTIFGEGAGLVRSSALARLRPGHLSPTGLLALGSRGNVFSPGQGTELIGFLGRVLERCMDRWLIPG